MDFDKNNDEAEKMKKYQIDNAEIYFSNYSTVIFITICLLLIIFIIIVLYAINVVHRYSTRKYRSRKSTNATLSTPLMLQQVSQIESNPQHFYINVNNADEATQSFLLETKEKIGGGTFGEVFMGELKKMNNGVTNSEKSLSVAIKKPLNSINLKNVRMLEKEAELMQTVGSHPNIVHFVGKVLTAESKRPVVILELCENGNLSDYLKMNKDSFLNEVVKSNDMEEKYKVSIDCNWELCRTADDEYLDRLCTSDLIAFSYQIARGMEHLSKFSCFYRDLAARNILVSTKKVCKISDFQFTRNVEEDHYSFLESVSVVLPSSWTSAGAIKKRRRSEAPDVRSYGLVLYEIFALGEAPNENLHNEINRKTVHQTTVIDEQIEKPCHCPKIIYNFMLKCLDKNAEKRPTFSECADFMKNQLAQVSPRYLNRLDKIRQDEETENEIVRLWLYGYTVFDQAVVDPIDKARKETEYTVLVENEQDNDVILSHTLYENIVHNASK